MSFLFHYIKKEENRNMILGKQEVREEGRSMESRKVELGVICKVEVDNKFAKNVASGEEIGEEELLKVAEQ